MTVKQSGNRKGIQGLWCCPLSSCSDCCPGAGLPAPAPHARAAGVRTRRRCKPQRDPCVQGPATPPGVVFHLASGIDETLLAQESAALRTRILCAFACRNPIKRCEARNWLVERAASPSTPGAGAMLRGAPTGVPVCGGAMHLIAFIIQRVQIGQIPEHVGPYRHGDSGPVRRLGAGAKRELGRLDLLCSDAVGVGPWRSGLTAGGAAAHDGTDQREARQKKRIGLRLGHSRQRAHRCFEGIVPEAAIECNVERQGGCIGTGRELKLDQIGADGGIGGDEHVQVFVQRAVTSGLAHEGVRSCYKTGVAPRAECTVQSVRDSNRLVGNRTAPRQAVPELQIANTCEADEGVRRNKGPALGLEAGVVSGKRTAIQVAEVRLIDVVAVEPMHFEVLTSKHQFSGNGGYSDVPRMRMLRIRCQRNNTGCN